jgi:hypothetical protein
VDFKNYEHSQSRGGDIERLPTMIKKAKKAAVNHAAAKNESYNKFVNGGTHAANMLTTDKATMKIEMPSSQSRCASVSEMRANEMTAKTKAPILPRTAKSLRRDTNILPEEGEVDLWSSSENHRPAQAKERREAPFVKASSRIFMNITSDFHLSNRNITTLNVGKCGQ